MYIDMSHRITWRATEIESNGKKASKRKFANFHRLPTIYTPFYIYHSILYIHIYAILVDRISRSITLRKVDHPSIV